MSSPSEMSAQSARNEWRDALKLMRIPFSVYLMPIFWLGASSFTLFSWWQFAQVFVILHLLLYPASNGFNSYHDRDTGPVGGLATPPPPNEKLLWLVYAADLAALIWSYKLGLGFFNWVLVYTLASKAYSWPKIRLKADPYLGTATVVLLQGAGTYYMTVMGLGICTCELTAWHHTLAAIGSSLTLLGNYPLTQVYQHADDEANGDMTLSRMLGIKGTFIWARIFMMIGGAAVATTLYINAGGWWAPALMLAIQAPALLHFERWARAAAENPEAANHANAMRMNQWASLGFSASLILVTLIVRYQLLGSI